MATATQVTRCYDESCWCHEDDMYKRHAHLTLGKILAHRNRVAAKPIGTCPACGETVYSDQDAVWTCPRDLSPSNRYWESSEVTDEQQTKAGVFSRCYEDFGGYCGDHMPLHGKCYEAGNY